MSFNQGRCDDRHKSVDKEFKAVWTEIKNQRGKLWAIILLLVGNLCSLVMGLIWIIFKLR